MADIIHLAARREADNQPDLDCITTDTDGQPMFCFAIDWRFADRSWTAQIWAYDWADAQARVEAMKTNLVVAHQVYAQGPL